MRHSERQNDYRIVFINFVQTVLEVDIANKEAEKCHIKILNKRAAQVKWIEVTQDWIHSLFSYSQ
jgi:hypothetical protein